MYGHVDASELSSFHHMQENKRVSCALIWFPTSSLCLRVVTPTLPFKQLPRSPFQELLQQPAWGSILSLTPVYFTHTSKALTALPSISCQIPLLAPFMEMWLHATGRKRQQVVRDVYRPL